MRKIVLYIAISLDGKIADTEGSVDWLESLPNPDQNDYGYPALLDRVDTTIMGNATYRQVLSFPIEFPYKDKKNFVITRNAELVEDEYATFVFSDHITFIQELKQQVGKDIWLIGGAEVNTLLNQSDLIDEYMVFVMPIILGKGIPLFSDHQSMKRLQLIENKRYKSGASLLHYRNN
ncbi:dihydrofolate reductase family protein [Marinoscillum sp. MHG1-6]|uniref:dihydrofolate reductase family protein n=1 Tax=Marinoscillum sp. MHG1-6 TaxID=2959627 RepID=UPI0021584E66|nr:dihydrofolate reductase family protein [Marinoscillum sp. MHG1-6]